MAKNAWSDEEMLWALDLRDHEMMSMASIAKSIGRSKLAVIGCLHRIDRDTDAVDVTPGLNGTMTRGWWVR